MDKPTAKTVHITTFGCQMNAYDSTRMAGMLAELGYEPAQSRQSADLILLNTCSVREHAAHKVYSHLGSMSGLKKKKPGLLIGVTGCLAQQEGETLLKRVPHLDLVLGPQALSRLPELVADAARGRRRVLTPLTQLEDAAPRPRSAGLKSLVTVMQGCDNFCSYCVVPYVRGRERSRAAAAVVDEVARLAAGGTREITLLGQNVNSYRDPESGGDFANLLEQVAQVNDLWRIRFTTSHPKDLSPSLTRAIAGLEKVMEQIHLPVQSGSDRILKAMNRGYSREQYLKRVAELRRAAPAATVGGDFIVGFPGESLDDFQQSLSLLDEVRYDFLYSFKYSDRPFTKARKMSDKVPEHEIARRLELLLERHREISLQLNQDLVGQMEVVLVEGPAKKGQGLMAGRGRGGRVVNFPGGPELKGRLVEVEVTKGRVNSLMGRLKTGGKGRAR